MEYHWDLLKSSCLSYKITHAIPQLRIDTSGGSLNCCAPFKKGWMCGSPQCYYVVQCIR